MWLIKYFITEKDVRFEITSLIPMYNTQKLNPIQSLILKKEYKETTVFYMLLRKKKV